MKATGRPGPARPSGAGCDADTRRALGVVDRQRGHRVSVGRFVNFTRAVSLDALNLPRLRPAARQGRGRGAGVLVSPRGI